MLIEPKTCAFCGRLFYTLDKHRKFCSEACLEDAARIRTRLQKFKTPPSPRQCPFCGKVFMANGKRKFCSAACRVDWHRNAWKKTLAQARELVREAREISGRAIAREAQGVSCETRRPIEPEEGKRK